MIFENYKLVIFDADGTLRECTVNGQEYPINQDQWIPKATIVNEISKYNWITKHFGIATNQPGITRNEFLEETCIELIEEMVMKAFGYLPPQDALQYCPHHIDGGCDCRKPQPGMLKRIMAFYKVEASQTLFVGDSNQDKGAAENAGCDFIWVHEIK